MSMPTAPEISVRNTLMPRSSRRLFMRMTVEVVTPALYHGDLRPCCVQECLAGAWLAAVVRYFENIAFHSVCSLVVFDHFEFVFFEQIARDHYFYIFVMYHVDGIVFVRVIGGKRLIGYFNRPYHVYFYILSYSFNKAVLFGPKSTASRSKKRHFSHRKAPLLF